MRRNLVVLLAVLAVLGACGRGESELDNGPLPPDDTTSSTTSTTTPDDDDDNDDDDGGDVVTDDSAADAQTSTTEPPSAVTSTTFVVDESSDNAVAYTELAASGLVLSLDEQSCADQEVDDGLEEGVDRLDAIISAVKTCAAPAAVDDFASGLISAGGAPLPPTEAACVASRLRSDDGYRPFWAALFAEEPFDFLQSELDVQNLYLGLFSECVSVGRALPNQLGSGLSPATVGCIDALYADTEFVRVTIEADLSGDPDEVERINAQIATCLTPEERAALGLA